MKRDELARAWMTAIYPTAYVPMSPAEIKSFLLEQVNVIADAPDQVAEVAERLVSAHFTGPETLRRTLEVLGQEFSMPVLAALSSNYATAMRLDAFDQQEQIKWALLTAKQRVERVLKVSEARFREVFTSSALGIAITDFDGVCMEANEALAEIVGHCSLTGRSLVELFHPEDAGLLRTLYRDVRDGVIDRVREQRRLVREDGEPVWVYLAASLLHDADGIPTHYVTIVEDISDLHLLRKNLDFQLLHDSLTGLSNRQHFLSQLETMHSRGPITLYHLDIDAFSVVNSGLGHEAGDRLLKVIARRLESVVAGQRALLARIGGDEFAIVSENSPEVPAMVKLINDELAEPTFVDGHGLALSVSVGAVDRPPPGTGVPELLRAASSALRQAKARGMRQWVIYDEHTDARQRVRFALAAAMPGAVENGELNVGYEPILDLPSRQVTGLAAVLRWGDRGHEQSLSLAEETGLSIPIGQWLLRETCAQAAQWLAAFGERTPMLHVTLSPLQSRDEDLVRHVKRTLDETGLPTSRLRIALNTGAVLDGDDNVRVLADSGISTGLDGFRGGHDELALLAETPVRGVTVRVAKPARESVPHTALANLVTTVRRVGVRVTVADVHTPDDADWWASIGADAAQGLRPAQSADEITAMLAH